MKEYGWGDTVKFEKETEITKGSESVQIHVDAEELYAKLCPPPKRRKKNEARRTKRSCTGGGLACCKR